MKITEKATLEGLDVYFGELERRIKEEQLTQICLPGKTDEFFYSDEDAGIVIDSSLQKEISTNYRLPLPVSAKSDTQFKQINVMNFIAKLVHQFEYDRFKIIGTY